MVYLDTAQLAVHLKGNEPTFHVQGRHNVQVCARIVQSQPARSRHHAQRTQRPIACFHLQLSHITRCPARDEQAGRCTMRVIPSQFDGHTLTSEACLDRRALRKNAAARNHQAGAPACRGQRDAAQTLDRDFGYTQGRDAPHFEDQVAQQRRRLALGWALETGIGCTKIDAQSARQNHHTMHTCSSGGKRNRHIAQRAPAARRQRRNRCRWLAGEIVGGSGAQVLHVKTVRRHLGRFPESMPRPAQSDDDAFRTHDWL